MVDGDGDQVEVSRRSGTGRTDAAQTLDDVDSAVVVLDDAGNVTYANDHAAALATVSAGDLTGMDVRDALPSLAGQQFHAARERAAARDDLVTYETRLDATCGRVEVCLLPSAEGVTACVRDADGSVPERRYEQLVETSPDAMFALDDDLVVTFVNEATETLTGYDRETLVGTPATELGDWGLFDDDDLEEAIDHARALVDGDRRYVKTELTQYDAGGEPFQAEYHVAAVDGGGLVGVVRDVTTRVRHQHRIRRQRDELDTLNRINELVNEIIGGLVDATSRSEIEETVCAYLAGSELYENAWIAERADGGGVAERTSAGDDRESFADLHDLDGTAVDVTLSTGETQVVTDSRTDDRIPESLRDELLDRDFQSGIAVSLAHGNARYGALVVNANRCDAFSDRERAAFEVLGETVGFAVNAVQNRQLLLGDNLAEFTFRITDSDAFFFRVADRLDCSCRLKWTMPDVDDGVLLYVSVADADPGDVLAIADDADDVRDARVLGDGDDGALFEVIAEDVAVTTLLDAGAKPTEIVAESGAARVTVEASPTVDVDTVTGALGATAEHTELVAKREVGRSTRTEHEFRDAVADRVTDRQRTVLEAAYHAGYFVWPRDCTAEDLASALDVSSPTVHYHLRRAQNALVDVFLHE